MMPLQISGGNQRPDRPQVSAAAVYRANDPPLSIDKQRNFGGTNQPAEKFIPVYTFFGGQNHETKNPANSLS
jgi:hypothetical protein